MNEVNGKYYPLWSQFIEQKDKWIGGTLVDFGDSMDVRLGMIDKLGMKTKIVDITLLPNGIDSAYFSIEGEGFGCGFDVHYGGISGEQQEGWLTFRGYGGHKFMIKEK